MRTFAFQKKITSLFLGIGIIICGESFAAPSQTYQKNSSEEVDECSKEIMFAYFPAPYVKATLKRYNVPENKWESIIQTLSEKDKTVISTVEEKAAKMNPNPLKDPSQQAATVKLFRETLTQIFSDVMKANGIKDNKQIETMLDDIQQQKAKMFAKCMEKQRNQSPQSANQQQQRNQNSDSYQNDTDSDDDDSDYDDDNGDDDDSDDDNDRDDEN